MGRKITPLPGRAFLNPVSQVVPGRYSRNPQMGKSNNAHAYNKLSSPTKAVVGAKEVIQYARAVAGGSEIGVRQGLTEGGKRSYHPSQRNPSPKKQFCGPANSLGFSNHMGKSPYYISAGNNFKKEQYHLQKHDVLGHMQPREVGNSGHGRRRSSGRGSFAPSSLPQNPVHRLPPHMTMGQPLRNSSRGGGFPPPRLGTLMGGKPDSEHGYRTPPRRHKHPGGMGHLQSQSVQNPFRHDRTTKTVAIRFPAFSPQHNSNVHAPQPVKILKFQPNQVHAQTPDGRMSAARPTWDHPDNARPHKPSRSRPGRVDPARAVFGSEAFKDAVERYGTAAGVVVRRRLNSRQTTQEDGEQTIEHRGETNGYLQVGVAENANPR